MRRSRLLIVSCTALLTLVVFPAVAGATTYSGEGLWGETNDVVITNVMFAVIIFFPVMILVLSLIQAYLEKRKHARIDAAKARASNADWQGGW
jgi:hypothetical protein